MDWHDSAKELCGHFTSRSTQETYTMDSRVTHKEKIWILQKKVHNAA